MRKNKTEYFIEKKVGMAINRFNMIESNDKVLVCVSGGKDSLALFKILNDRKKRLPIDYEIRAINITTDYEKDILEKKAKLKNFFDLIGCTCIFKDIEIKQKNKLNKEDCFFCSWNRRKEIFETAEKMGFNKIAFGHHKDDVIETILMNLFFNGEISSINPVQKLFKGKITIIRPLILLEEKEIFEYIKKTAINTVKSVCPRNYDSKRFIVKDIIQKLSKLNPYIKSNILKAPTRIKKDYITEI